MTIEEEALRRYPPDIEKFDTNGEPVMRDLEKKSREAFIDGYRFRDEELMYMMTSLSNNIDFVPVPYGNKPEY